MIKTASLDNLYFTLFNDTESFYLTENAKLKLSFTCNRYNLKDGILKLKNGKIIKNYSFITDNEKDYYVEIGKDDDILQVGKLFVFVDFPQIQKTYNLDGFYIKEPENDGIKQFTSFFEELITSIENIQNRLSTLENLNKNPFEF